MPNAPIKRALISVSDKTGIVDFAQSLFEHGVELVSTGGSAKLLRENGLSVRDVSELTGFPEMMDGRVKTLHPNVHGALLAVRGNSDHETAAEQHGIQMIDLLVVNLYPFEETVASGADYDTCVENIDIGGPAMIRAAAKNHDSVTVVVDGADYQDVLNEMASGGGSTSLELRRKLAGKAYARTAAYDAAIGNWFAEQTQDDAPDYRTFGGRLKQTLRYGENPHQSAALYIGGPSRPGVATATQLQGKELSYNNLNDTDAAYELVSEFDQSAPTVAIIKHANPCGVASASSLADAYKLALRCDPVSAFGGIVAFNQTLDVAAVEAMADVFTEVIIAPEVDSAAKAMLAERRNVRVLEAGALADVRDPGLSMKLIAGGLLVQSRDNGCVDDLDLKVVTERQPTEQEMADLKFAFRVCKHVKSNAIIYVKDGATVGIGAGQMSRVDSARIAAWKGQEAADAAGIDTRLTEGSVVASDAFFPFADGLLTAADAGATAVIQPGGSMRDDDVIAAANERGLAMVMTGMRHFRH